MKRYPLLIALTSFFLVSCDGENIEIFLPEVKTNQASNISATEAQLNGTLTKLGSAAITSIGFEFSQDAVTLANDDGEQIKLSVDATTAPLDFEHTLINLTAGAEYHFRAYAITENGEAFGEIFSYRAE